MSTFCMNISNEALTKSTGNLFLRQWRIGNKNYGVDSTGIFLIDGDLDGDVGFDSFIKTSENTLNEESTKRLPEIRLDKNGVVSTALIYDGNAVGDGVEQGNSGFIRFGKGSGGRFISLILHSNDEDFKLRSIKLMPQTTGLGAL
jgi:hypothetical protein